MSTHHRERYADGTFKDTRARTDLAYRERQRRQRAWIKQFADTIGVTKEEVVKLDPGDLAQAYQHYMTNNPRR